MVKHATPESEHEPQELHMKNTATFSLIKYTIFDIKTMFMINFTQSKGQNS